METVRVCYTASRVFCPMLSAERDGDLCLRCGFFAGVLTKEDRLAFACSWSPENGYDNVTSATELTEIYNMP